MNVGVRKSTLFEVWELETSPPRPSHTTWAKTKVFSLFLSAPFSLFGATPHGWNFRLVESTCVEYFLTVAHRQLGFCVCFVQKSHVLVDIVEMFHAPNLNIRLREVSYVGLLQVFLFCSGEGRGAQFN